MYAALRQIPPLNVRLTEPEKHTSQCIEEYGTTILQDDPTLAGSLGRAGDLACSTHTFKLPEKTSRPFNEGNNRD